MPDTGPFRCIAHWARSAPAPSPANLAGQDRPGKIENNRMAKKKNSPFGLFFSLVSGSYLQLILPYRSH